MATKLPSTRHRLTDRQMEILEAEFSISQYPDITTRDRLSKTLNFSNLFILMWFQLRRMRPHSRQTPKATFGVGKYDFNDGIPHHVTSNQTSRKRKSPCDIDDYGFYDQPFQPSKKPAMAPAPMHQAPLSHSMDAIISDVHAHTYTSQFSYSPLPSPPPVFMAPPAKHHVQLDHVVYRAAPQTESGCGALCALHGTASRAYHCPEQPAAGLSEGGMGHHFSSMPPMLYQPPVLPYVTPYLTN